MDNKDKTIIALVLVVGLIAGSSLFVTTVQNTDEQTEVDPQVELRVYDSSGEEITDIYSATISGTISFAGHITNDPYPAVESMKMFVYPVQEDGSKGSLIETIYLTQDSEDTRVYSADWASTSVPDGDYILEFYVVQEAAGGGSGDGDETMFSSFAFSSADNDGYLDPVEESHDYLIPLLVVGGIFSLAGIAYAYREL